jgi:hypothetical protein
MSSLNERPLGISIISIAFIIIGIVFLAIMLPATGGNFLYAILSIIVGIGSLLCGYGLFKGKSWSRWLSILLLISILMILVINTATSSNLINPLIYGFIFLPIILFLVYFQKRTVKSYF